MKFFLFGPEVFGQLEQFEGSSRPRDLKERVVVEATDEWALWEDSADSVAKIQYYKYLNVKLPDKLKQGVYVCLIDDGVNIEQQSLTGNVEMDGRSFDYSHPLIDPAVGKECRSIIHKAWDTHGHRAAEYA